MSKKTAVRQVPTKLVYVSPNTVAHRLPIRGDGVTALCGCYTTFLRWKDDEHVNSLPLCVACARAS